jgi:hypothetical protein
MDRSTITLHLSPDKPLVLDFPLGCHSTDYVRFVRASAKASASRLLYRAPRTAHRLSRVATVVYVAHLNHVVCPCIACYLSAPL